MADRYLAIHQAPNGPGDSRLEAQQIIRDENLEGKFGDKSILITGYSAGIGVETTKASFSTGATLILTARDICKARIALGDIVQSSRVHLLELDLESLGSVRSCANEVKASSPALQSRVVILSSIAHRFFEFDFKDIDHEGFHGTPAYAASKMANLWTANEIERRFGPEGIHAWSVQPGAVISELTREMSEQERQTEISDPLMKNIFKNAAQGASTTVWGAVAATLEGQGGGYLEDLQMSPEFDAIHGPTSNGYGPQAMNELMAKEMWEISLALVGLDPQ